jgi:hypothetical protein
MNTVEESDNSMHISSATDNRDLLPDVMAKRLTLFCISWGPCSNVNLETSNPACSFLGFPYSLQADGSLVLQTVTASFHILLFHCH